MNIKEKSLEFALKTTVAKNIDYILETAKKIELYLNGKDKK